MSPEIQQVAALGIVAVAALGLLLRQIRRRKKPGCAGSCACPSRKVPH